MMSTRSMALVLTCLLVIWACEPSENSHSSNLLFQTISAAQSGIDFQNDVQYTEEFNVYTYRNFYNGGGVGIGDINNDGLSDLYFCGNQVDNKLYLNRGNFQFEDVTEQAGVACPNVWSTGVSMADINQDGWLDLFVTKAGAPGGENRHNELFINNGDGTFTEQAEAYGLADEGLSTHAAFFDYDKDGDLDCYLLNNSVRSVSGYDLIEGLRETPDTDGGNRFYRNDGGTFVNVSQEVGVYSSAIGFGLGVTIGDVNGDGWQDMYISNDFFERDYLYINQQDGTFRESLVEGIQELSLSSMGADMADLNNDGFPEIFVTDMLPEKDARMKTKTAFENWDKYQLNIREGYHRQFTRNALQFNLGNGQFSEVSRFAGVHGTDWSWGALMADFDLDGFRDIYVANGIFKDLTDQDYINFYADPETVRAIMRREEGVITKLVDAIPSVPISNYAFSHRGQWEFENKAKQWGLDQPGFSNGSAYGDLGNDGDLDLVVNNVNMPP
ncbi:MAG: VCBS repeat-containing protein, partial [Bacteroidota bacterium]